MAHPGGDAAGIGFCRTARRSYRYVSLAPQDEEAALLYHRAAIPDLKGSGSGLARQTLRSAIISKGKNPNSHLFLRSVIGYNLYITDKKGGDSYDNRRIIGYQGRRRRSS